MSKSEKIPTPRKPPAPKWLEGPHHENAPKAKKHEYRLASQLGGRRYSGSGNRIWRHAERKSERTGQKPSAALWTRGAQRDGRPAREHKTDNGDLANPKFHLEHKFTRDASVSVKLEWLDKVREGAAQHMKQPGLIITFDRRHLGTKTPREEWVLVPLDVLERLLKLK